MDPQIAQKYPLGSSPHIHFLPYLIFISYIVSLIGAITTVELLHRRLSGTGWRSWVQLAACSVSFGLVAIWCMHFVGNRAIVLGDGESDIQLYYSAAFTAVSAILPIVVIFMGLLVADRFHKNNKGLITRYVALLVCGVCAGAAVTEMHYLGNQGTTNFRLKLSMPYIIGAASIAVGACLIAFALFFHWSGHWMNNIWRRFLVACFLAVAVSGMHWTAAAGTSYEITGYHTGSGQAGNVNLIIAVCLCLSACGVCFAMGFIKQREEKKLKDRAQQVVLAVATFDEEGRMLVTPSGLLPCQTITRQFHQRTFDEDLNTCHPVFHWLFRVSRNWSGIIDLIPAMRDHLHQTGYLQTNTPVMGDASRNFMGAEDDTSYSATFREMFCVTAQDIARTMETRLQNLGQLFEEVLVTGTLLTKTLFRDTNGKNIIAADVAKVQNDIEAGTANPILFGRGQLLVLTRKVDADEASRLQNIGFRFANMDHVGEQLARSLQIARDDLHRLVARLEAYCDREPSVPCQGTYLASFLLQPSPVLKGLDVIVTKQNPDRLPMVKMAEKELSTTNLRLLSAFHGHTLDECLTRINQCSGHVTADYIFLEKFRNKIHELLREVPEPILHNAIFSCQQLDIAHGTGSKHDLFQATVFAFCGIREVYNQSFQSPKLQFVPLSFFKTNLRTYPGGPDHGILAHRNHKEFSALFSSPPTVAPSTTRHGTRWPGIFRIKSPSMSETSIVNPDNSSEKGLVPMTSFNADALTSASHPFGGIMVSQQVTVSGDQENGSATELRELGFRSDAGVGDIEQLTMADRLMSITTAFRDPHSRSMARDQYNRR